MSVLLGRRRLLAHAGTVAAMGLASRSARVAAETAARADDGQTEPFSYCLNTSTIRAPDLGLPGKIRIAAEAGYQGIEPWIREIDQYVEAGGTVKDLSQRIADAGLRVESAIAFAHWIDDDDARRRQGLEAARRDMDLVRRIGGRRIAAPPAGASRPVDLQRVAERYRELLELGETTGVVPQLELWGHSPALSRLGQLMYVAVECGHRAACLLPDVYHIYKGGSDFGGLDLINGHAIHVFHLNDYPAEPPRATITDADRVFPGDGTAPLAQLLRSLRATRFCGALSLELFNRQYWQQDALQVARRGLEKMRAAVRNAFT